MMTSEKKRTSLRIGWVVLALVISVALANWLPREITPQQTIERFESAINRGAYAEISSMVVGGTKDLSGFDGLSKTASQDVVCTIHVHSVQVTGDRAVADLSSKCTEGPNGMPSSDTFHYREKVTLARHPKKGWKIVPPAEWPSQSLVAAFACFAAKPALASEFWASAKRPRPPHHGLMQSSKMKMIATGLLLSVSDNNDYFPKSQARIKIDLVPYLQREDLYTAPQSKTILPLFMNPSLIGTKYRSVKQPSETPMLAWGKPGALWFDNEGFTYIAFTDGQVKKLDRRGAARLQWKL